MNNLFGMINSVSRQQLYWQISSLEINNFSASETMACIVTGHAYFKAWDMCINTVKSGFKYIWYYIINDQFSLGS